MTELYELFGTMNSSVLLCAESSESLNLKFLDISSRFLIFFYCVFKSISFLCFTFIVSLTVLLILL